MPKAKFHGEAKTPTVMVKVNMVLVKRPEGTIKVESTKYVEMPVPGFEPGDKIYMSVEEA